MQNDVIARAVKRAKRLSGAVISPATTLGPEIVDLTRTAEFISQRGDPRITADALAIKPLRTAPVVVNGVTEGRGRRHRERNRGREVSPAAGGTNVFTHIPDIPEPVLEGAVARRKAKGWFRTPGRHGVSPSGRLSAKAVDR